MAYTVDQVTAVQTIYSTASSRASSNATSLAGIITTATALGEDFPADALARIQEAKDAQDTLAAAHTAVVAELQAALDGTLADADRILDDIARA